MRVRRNDNGTLGEIQHTPTGGIIVQGRTTRVGVFCYRLGDGSERRELRPPEEVFAAESLQSLRFAAVTELHPITDVNPANWRETAVGVVGPEITHDDRYVEAPIIVNTQSTIGKVDSRELCELSSGYNCDLEMTAGVWQGEPFDAIQRNIRYNHVALLPEGSGRAGPEVRLRLDSQDAICISETTKKENRKMKLKIKRADGKTYEIDADKAQAEIDALQSRLDTATDPATFKRRLDMLDTARKLAHMKKRKLDEDELIEMAEPDLLVQMIKIVRPDFDPGDKSEDYVTGVFEATIPPILEQWVAQNGEQSEPELTDAPEASAETTDEPAALDSKHRTRDSKRTPRPVFGGRPEYTGNNTRADSGEDAGDKARRDQAEANRNRAKRK